MIKNNCTNNNNENDSNNNNDINNNNDNGKRGNTDGKSSKAAGYDVMVYWPSTHTTQHPPTPAYSHQHACHTLS